MTHIRDCLIVAAGKGTRLKGLGDSKPLVTLAGVPLIEHAMHAAAHNGVEHFVVVTGYQAEPLQAFLVDLGKRQNWKITFAFNPEYHKENGLSVLCAEPYLPGEFYLAMCDHLVEPQLYDKLAKAELPKGAVGLGVDLRLSNPMVDLDDVTKVQMQGKFIQKIGKELNRYDSFDTGIFRANPNLFHAIKTAHNEHGDCSISGGMKILAHANRAIGIDIGQANWIDVDSQDMHELAENWMRENQVR